MNIVVALLETLHRTYIGASGLLMFLQRKKLPSRFFLFSVTFLIECMNQLFSLWSVNSIENFIIKIFVLFTSVATH